MLFVAEVCHIKIYKGSLFHMSNKVTNNLALYLKRMFPKKNYQKAAITVLRSEQYEDVIHIIPKKKSTFN